MTTGLIAGAAALGLGVGTVVLTQQANAATIDTGAHYVLKNRNSGKALDVRNFSKADGAVLNQWSINNGDWQQFAFLDMGGGNYRLQAKHSGKVVDVKGASKADGAQIVQSTGDRTAASQQWSVQDMGGGYVRLVNRNSSKVLAIAGGSTADGGNAVASTGDRAAAGQQWQLVKVGAATGGGAVSPNAPWPTATGTKPVSASVKVSGTLDGGMTRYYGTGALGGSGQDEGQDPIFDLADGATLKNVILGSPAADGVHCAGTCTLINVWWEDVGEDAATFRGGTNAVFTINGGGARNADDKVFQHNGGGTLTITNFQVTDFGKLYRSCGNCSTQYKRTLIVVTVTVTAPGDLLAGVNTNYGDTATFRNITIIGDKTMDICTRFTGNSTGKEPTRTGSGPDGTTCKYTTADVTFE
ncbi:MULTISPECIES: pectate lyase [Catenuloplanes]|uniref:pectate lyase n=1 Tax=Catenuloplanes niger TaxID=587534 RepID=A0AAE3ZVW5_9ACTN|nr:pectate lyase [Catenuloplanes niger]MDR7324840.1 hypothetical protein [Catenuloplanes niger]